LRRRIDVALSYWPQTKEISALRARLKNLSAAQVVQLEQEIAQALSKVVQASELPPTKINLARVQCEVMMESKLFLELRKPDQHWCGPAKVKLPRSLVKLREEVLTQTDPSPDVVPIVDEIWKTLPDKDTQLNANTSLQSLAQSILKNRQPKWEQSA